MKLELLRVTNSTTDSVSLWFKKPDEIQTYKAGQYARLSLSLGQETVSRTYSLHTSPDLDNDLGITVRAVDGGIVSNYLLTNAKNNIHISLDEVEGDFTIEPSADTSRHLIMFAGGSGITPIFSMIRTILYNEPGSGISLIYSNKSYSKIIFSNEIHFLEAEFSNRFKVYHVITQEESSSNDFPIFYKGRLSNLIVKKLIKNILADVNAAIEYYLCGPYAFMQLIEEGIRSIFPDQTKICKEHFFIPDQKPLFDPATLPDRHVVIRSRGKELSLMVQGGKSILQAALEQNVGLPYSCTEGQCGRCRAVLVSGEVALRKNHVLTEEELKDKQILLCQGFPITDGVTIRASV